MSDYNDARRRAYEKGSQAFTDNKDRWTGNPYKRKPFSVDWYNGFIAAECEAKAEGRTA